MRLTRIKRARKIVAFFRSVHGFTPPFDVLVDGEKVPEMVNLREQQNRRNQVWQENKNKVFRDAIGELSVSQLRQRTRESISAMIREALEQAQVEDVHRRAVRVL